MCADRYLNFDQAFLNKYATLPYYLSKGANGIVYGPIQWNDTQLAIKQTTFAAGKVTEELKKNIDAKKDILASIEHKHLIIIHSIDLSQLPKAMFIVMEFAAGSSVHETLKSLGGSGQKLPIDVVREWAKQIAEGMLYLHERNVVHRDLKSSNILLMEPFDIHKPRIKMTLKIADFDEVKNHDHTVTMSLVGTVAYMAPEVILKERFSKGSDVWSYGVVIWEMLTGDTPHKGLTPSAIMLKAITGELGNLKIEESFTLFWKQLLNRCLEPIILQRASFHDVVSILQVSDDARTENKPIDSINVSTRERLVYDRNQFQEDQVTQCEPLRQPVRDQFGAENWIFNEIPPQASRADYRRRDAAGWGCLRIKKGVKKRGCLEPILFQRASFNDAVSILQVSDDARTENKPIDSINVSTRERLVYDRNQFQEDQVTQCEPLRQPVQDQFGAENWIFNETPSQPLGEINGLAVLGQEVFISSRDLSDIDVFYSTTFDTKRRMTVSGMTSPQHIVSCSVNNCLYVFDWNYQGQISAVLRIDPLNGNLLKTWPVNGGGGCISVASDTNVILNINYEAMLHEYTADGQLIRKINVGLGTFIIRSWHAVKLPSGLFVLCHGEADDPQRRVCLLSIKSTTNTAGNTDEVEIMNSFGAEPGESINRLMGPSYLSVDKMGSILISDIPNRRAVLIDSNFDVRQILIPEEFRVGFPCRTCFNESTGQWFVAAYHSFMVYGPIQP